MKIAVLTPTINRPAGLRRSLKSLKATAPTCTPVVAAEKGDAQARNIAAEFGAIFTVVSEPLAGGAKAWNDALRAAPDFDAYFTGSDDIEYTPGWLEEVLRLLDVDLKGSGLVGINDNRWGRDKVEKMCATHYLMTRDFVIEHMGGVAAQPFYFCDWTDMEATARARRAGKFTWAEKAVVKHLWDGPKGDPAYIRAAKMRPAVRLIWNDRKERGFPDDFEPIIK